MRSLRWVWTSALLSLVVACGAAPPGHAGSRPTPARVDSLRAIGHYSEALQTAVELRDALRATPSTPAWDKVDAEWMVRTMERASGLSEAEQARLQHADRARPRVYALVDGGHYREALVLADSVLEEHRVVLGPEFPDVATALEAKAIALHESGQVADAAPISREAYDLRLRLQGRVHPRTANALELLGRLTRDLSRLPEAEACFLECMELFRATVGPRDRRMGTSLDDYALLLGQKGDYVGAAEAARQGLEIREATLPADDPVIGWSRLSLATFSLRLGEYRTSDSLYGEVERLWTARLGPRHPRLADLYHQMGASKLARGDTDAAERLLRKALDVAQSSEVRDIILAGIHGKFGDVYLVRGEYGDGLREFEAARVLYTRSLGPGHPWSLSRRMSVAGVQLHQHRLADAEQTLRGLLDDYETARGELPPTVTRSRFARSPYGMLGLLLLHEGQTAGVWDLIERQQARSLLDAITAAHPENGAGDAGGDGGVDGVLGTHGATARAASLAEVQDALAEDAAILGWIDPGPVFDAAGYRPWCYVIRHRGPVTWIRLSSATDPFYPGDPVRTWLEPITRRFRRPRELSPEERWGRCSPAIKAYWSGVRSPATSARDLRTAGQAVTRGWIAPSLASLEGVNRLVVVPSGAMLGIPIEALPLPRSEQLVGDRFLVSYAPSASVYIWLVKAEEGRRHDGLREGPASCLAVADPPFCSDDLVSIETGTEPSESCGGFRGLFRSLPDAAAPGHEEAVNRLRSAALAGNHQALSSLRRLPCSRLEAEAIVHRLAGRHELLLGTAACEPTLATMAGLGSLETFDVIHIATHALVDNASPERSALVLSQLGPPNTLDATLHDAPVYDGLVTAREIATSWRLDAELVTLSACDSGLGQNIGNEGYVGLAYAFLQSGARNLLVSLWPVDDLATYLLMDRFYEYWNGGRDPGVTMAEALQRAKVSVREWTSGDGSRPHADPCYWAGFVLLGRGQ